MTYSFQMFLDSLRAGILDLFHKATHRLSARTDRVPLKVLTSPSPVWMFESTRLAWRHLPLPPRMTGPEPAIHWDRGRFDIRIPRNRINMLLKGIEETLAAMTSEFDLKKQALPPVKTS
mgnify:FL=1